MATCPTYDDFDKAMKDINRKTGGEFFQTIDESINESCGKGGGKRKSKSKRRRTKRMRGGTVNPRFIKMALFVIFALFMAKNIYGSDSGVEVIKQGIAQIMDGTCDSAVTRWAYLKNPLCTFWIGYVDSVRDALRGNPAALATLYTIFMAILRAPGDLNYNIGVLADQIARIVNGPPAIMPPPALLAPVAAPEDNSLSPEEENAAAALAGMREPGPEQDGGRGRGRKTRRRKSTRRARKRKTKRRKRSK